MKTRSIRTVCVICCAGLGPIWNAAAQTAPNNGQSPGKDYSHSSVVTRMMAFDKKHDGKLTRDEITDWRFLRLFDEADANHDGVVTLDELEALAAKLDVPAPQGPGGFGGPGGPGGFGGPPPGDFGGPGPRRHVDWQKKVSELDLSKLPADSDAKDLTYEKDIKPIFSASCTQCHGSERTRGGLRLDSLDALRQGGDSGPAFITGNSKESHLVIAASRIDPDTAMPPQRGRRPDPSGMLSNLIMRQAGGQDASTITKEQFVNLARTWFEKVDSERTGKVTQQQLVSAVAEMLRQQAPGGGRPGRPGGFGPGGRGGFDPVGFSARALFDAASGQKDQSLTSEQLQEGFAKLFDQWGPDQSGSLTDQKLRTGLAALMPAPPFGGNRQGPPGGGPGGFRGPGGPGDGGPDAKPLIADQVALLRAWIDQGAK